MLPATAISSGRPPLVLLVDDDADSCEMYAFALTRHGFETIQASRAAIALNRIRESTPDVVVTDVLADGCGFGLIRDMRANAATKHIKVVVVTGCAFPCDRERAFDAGCDGFLTKPCLPDALEHEIRRLLAREETALSAP